MRILEYSECADKAHWLSEIKKSDWKAGKYLAELLGGANVAASAGNGVVAPAAENADASCEFYRLCGTRSKLFLLTEGDALVSFCSFTEKDDIPDTELSPWIGFVYTFPQYRGKRRMGVLFTHVFRLAKSQGVKAVYISTHDEGLYEKYGFSYFSTMKDVMGEDSRIYKLTFENKDYSGIIGKTVSGKIDRPLGSRHPRHPEMIYPLNYGYVDGVFAGDGAEQDVYLLGETKPVLEYTGKVIAVYHRLNDVEDKWVVAADGTEKDFADDEILDAIAFQEQYFVGELYR